MKNFRKNIVVLLITLLSLTAIFVIPLVIDSFYKVGSKLKHPFITNYAASDILTFYGALLAGALTIVGVFFTVQVSHKQYKEDMLKRVLPFLTVNAFANSYHSDVFEDLLGNPANEAKENDIYQIHEVDFKSIYFLISNKIEVVYSLSDLDKKAYMMSTNKVYKNNGVALVKNHKSYKSINIINSGNGPAVNLSISISRSDEKDSGASAIALSLHVGEKVYLAFCVNNENNMASGDYIMHYNYKDIYQNEYNKYQNLTFHQGGGTIEFELY
jgi:hypothetical protein